MRRKLRLIATGMIAIGSYWLLVEHAPEVAAEAVPEVTQETAGEVESPEPKAIVLDVVEFDRITYYQAVPEQTDSDPHISACGPNIQNQVAVSRDLFRNTLHCGDVLQVWGEHGYIGEFTVWDTMHPRFDKTLDILTVEPYDWGRTAGHAVILKEVN